MCCQIYPTKFIGVILNYSICRVYCFCPSNGISCHSDFSRFSLSALVLRIFTENDKNRNGGHIVHAWGGESKFWLEGSISCGMCMQLFHTARLLPRCVQRHRIHLLSSQLDAQMDILSYSVHCQYIFRQEFLFSEFLWVGSFKTLVEKLLRLSLEIQWHCGMDHCNGLTPYSPLRD